MSVLLTKENVTPLCVRTETRKTGSHKANGRDKFLRAIRLGRWVGNKTSDKATLTTANLNVVCLNSNAPTRVNWCVGFWLSSNVGRERIAARKRNRVIPRFGCKLVYACSEQEEESTLIQYIASKSNKCFRMLHSQHFNSVREALRCLPCLGALTATLEPFFWCEASKRLQILERSCTIVWYWCFWAAMCNNNAIKKVLRGKHSVFWTTHLGDGWKPAALSTVFGFKGASTSNKSHQYIHIQIPSCMWQPNWCSNVPRKESSSWPWHLKAQKAPDKLTLARDFPTRRLRKTGMLFLIFSDQSSIDHCLFLGGRIGAISVLLHLSASVSVCCLSLELLCLAGGLTHPTMRHALNMQFHSWMFMWYSGWL